MANLWKGVKWKPVLGEPQVIGDRAIRLQSQAISLVTPFGGFVWNRPTAVFIEKDDITEEIPIVDVTRYALIGIGVIGIVGMILADLPNRLTRSET